MTNSTTVTNRLRSLIVVAAVVLAGCTTSAVSKTSSHTSGTPTPPPITTTPTTAMGPTVLPVGTCAQTSGGPSTGPAWVPTQLGGAVPSAIASQLEYYSVGTETALGPRGWSCAQLAATDGSSALDVYPPGQPNPITSSSQVGQGAQIVAADFDYTGHGPGVQLACRYFPHVASADQPCSTSVLQGEQVHQITPDVVTITDPAGVKGSLEGSGGPGAVTGLMIIPQAPNVAGGVGVATESCSLTNAELCQSILQDFLVRQLPVPTYPPS